MFARCNLIPIAIAYIQTGFIFQSDHNFRSDKIVWCPFVQFSFAEFGASADVGIRVGGKASKNGVNISTKKALQEQYDYVKLLSISSWVEFD